MVVVYGELVKKTFSKNWLLNNFCKQDSTGNLVAFLKYTKRNLALTCSSSKITYQTRSKHNTLVYIFSKIIFSLKQYLNEINYTSISAITKLDQFEKKSFEIYATFPKQCFFSYLRHGLNHFLEHKFKHNLIYLTIAFLKWKQ